MAGLANLLQLLLQMSLFDLLNLVQGPLAFSLLPFLFQTFLLSQLILPLDLLQSALFLFFLDCVQPFDVLLSVLDDLVTLEGLLVFPNFIFMVILHHDGAQPIPFGLLTLWVDHSPSLVKDDGHVDQLVTDLFAGHHLQGGSFGLLFALALAQVDAEMNASFT